MTNMKAKLRSTNIKYHIKTRGFNLKSKERVPLKKNAIKEKSLAIKKEVLSQKVIQPKISLIPNKPKKVVNKKKIVNKPKDSGKSKDQSVNTLPTNNTPVDPKSQNGLEIKVEPDKKVGVVKLVNGKKKSAKSGPKKRCEYKCEDCGKVFQGKNDLRKHSYIHSGVRPHTCEHCNKKFRQAGNLRNHITSYHSEAIENPKVFICDYCNRSFLIKERLRMHMRVHTGYKPYSCPLCPMRFARLGQLRQHERTHTGVKNFICVHCNAAFTCGAKLRLHIKGHLDIRDYTCYLCGKSFIRPDSIKKHMSCFHNGEKPFTCPVCKKSLKGHLQEHMRTHSLEKPHGCADCGSRFAQRSQLTVHQRKHSGARPYRCRVCWKAFAHSTALTLHTRHHTGEKPFKCRLCGITFAQLPHMKKHLHFVHGDGRAYGHEGCGSVFNTKSELDKHKLTCNLSNRTTLGPEEELSRRIAEAYQPVEPPMPLTKMRLLLAVLLQKISSIKRLRKLGFNKRLIDDILIDSLESSGHKPCKDGTKSIAEKLKVNVQLFLEWTVPPRYMEKFRSEQKSTEELLEELTS